MARLAASTSSGGRKPKNKVLRGVHPNAGIEAAYRKNLDTLITEMQASVEYWLTATYRQNEARITQDASPADLLQKSIRQLSRRWLKRFDTMAGKLATYFATSVEQRSTSALRRILKDGGMTVEFQMTPAMKDVLTATVNQNMALIKSIPQQYLSEVEGMVMRSVQAGRDLSSLSDDLQKRYGITRRRAALIARSQNEMATSTFNKVRLVEAGVEEAVWVHSHAGKTYRKSHVKAGKDRVRYRIAEGWYDPAEGRHIQPGELINCRCFSRPVIKGFL